MDSGVKKFHPISESESESNFSVSSKKVKSIGLMPRKENPRACKGKKTNTSVSTNSCPKPTPSPIIDNSGSSRNLPVEDGEDAISSISADQNLSQSQLDTMNDKLNKLLDLVNREQVDEQLEDGQISDNDIEDEEDSSIYFHSITEKDTKQGPTINEPLALGVTNILQSGLNTTSIDSFKDIYVCPENCKIKHS